MRLAAMNRFTPVLFILLVSTFVVEMAAIGSSAISLKIVLFSLAFSALLLYAGVLVLQMFKWGRGETVLPAAFITGFVLFSVGMMMLALLTGMRAKASSMIVGALILLWGYWKKTDQKWMVDYGNAVLGFAIFAAAIIGTFSFIPVSSPVVLQKSGLLPIWSDYFIHGETIAAFGSPIATTANMELAGESPVFYHYAPFMLPAAFQAFSGISGLAAATSFLLPLGLLICTFGIYVFAVELGGRSGGMLAVTTTALVPAYSLFVQSGWFDFDWLLFIAPGTGYALGIAFLICALLARHFRTREPRALWLMGILLLSLIVVRVHIFMLLAPVVTVMLAHTFWPKRVLALSGAIFAIIIVAMLAALFVPALNELWMNFSHPYDYLTQSLDGARLNGQQISGTLQPAMQLLLVVAAVLGAYAFLTPLLAWRFARRSGFSSIQALPYLMLITFIGLMLFAPSARNGDLSEYKHRHFPLIYATFAIYFACYAVTLAERILGKRMVKKLVSIVIGGVLIFSLIFFRGINPASPDIATMAWGSQFHNQKILPGLYEAGNFLREHAKNGDVMTMPAESINGMVNNEIIEVISLSGVPAFLARPSMKISASECMRNLVNRRLRTISRISAAANWPEAAELMRSNGIRWFLIPEKAVNGWLGNNQGPVFRSGVFVIYDAGSDTHDKYANSQC